MKCIKCSKDADVKIEDKIFCSNCFCEVIEKRVRKDIRNQEIFFKENKERSRKDIKILILDDNSEKSALNKYLLKNIIKDSRVVFIVKKIDLFILEKAYDLKRKYDKIVIPWNLDDEIANYVSSLLQNNKIRDKNDKKIIIPLIGITNNEALIFSRIKKLNYKINKNYDDIHVMIENLDKKYPGTKFSILKTIRKTNLK